MHNNKDSFNKYFVFNKFFLSTCGLWPYQRKLYSKFFRYFWFIQQMVTLVAKAIKIYELRNEVDLLIEACAAYGYNILTTIKFINGIIMEKRVKMMLEKIKKDWDDLKDDSDYEILIRYAKSGKSINLIYIIAFYNVMVSYMLLPLIPILLNHIKPLNESRPKEPVMMVEFFVDPDKYYYHLLVHAYFSLICGITPILGMDTFYMNCIYHACGIYDILGHRIERILKENPKSKGMIHEEDHRKLTKCIIQHQKIIKFCEVVNKTYGTSFLIVLFLCITMMSVTGVATVINLTDTHNFKNVGRYGIFTMGQTLHLFLFNYLGQNLLNSGESFGEKLYTCNWYESSIKIKKLINFMMLRASRLPSMQARIFLLCLPTFTSVMKTSMSYFTVLRSTR